MLNSHSQVTRFKLSKVNINKLGPGPFTMSLSDLDLVKNNKFDLGPRSQSQLNRQFQ